MKDQKELSLAQTEVQAEDGKELTEAEMQDVVGGTQPDPTFVMPPFNPGVPPPQVVCNHQPDMD